MRYLQGQAHQLPGNRATLAGYRASHFLFGAGDGVATLTLNRPDRKNPLTFDSYAEPVSYTHLTLPTNREV